VDNHNLIYWFAHKHHLNLDEFYDILAIALCQAALNFDSFQGFTFYTYVNTAMLNSVRIYEREKHLGRVIPEGLITSLNEPVSEDDKTTGAELLSLIPDPTTPRDHIVDYISLCEFLKNLSEQEKQLVKALLANKKEVAIAMETGVSQPSINRAKKRLRKKWEYYHNANY
jgi:RNA polymerase sigma factor (sigma-70 family)